MESPQYSGGRYLTFRVARQEFALDAERVRGIVPAAALAPCENPTPADPPWLAGFVKMNCGVLPVINLRGKLGLPEGTPGRDPCIVVVEAETPAGARLAGFLADRVSEVVTARARDFRGGKLRIGRPRKVLDADLVLAKL